MTRHPGEEDGPRTTTTTATSAFLPEPFPIADRGDARAHLHDAFGDGDDGVDYGPPNECEDDEDDDEDEDDEGEGEDDDEDVPGDESGRPSSCGGTVAAGDEGEGEGEATAGADAVNDGGSAEEDRRERRRRPDAPDAAAVVVSIEELEEEVAMRESTLESLASKLGRLIDEISSEDLIASTLRDELRMLEGRRTTSERRKDENERLVGVLEASLERCAERLARALDAPPDDDDDDDDRDDNDGNDEDEDEASGEHVFAMVPGPSAVDDDRGGNDEGVRHRAESHTTIEGIASRREGCAPADFPLDAKYDVRGEIRWAACELVETVHGVARTLPCDCPTWRTCRLSSSFLGGIDSVDLIYDAMNVAVLERSLGRISSDDGGGGWVDEVDVWGTTLDVYTHVDWMNLFACLSRSVPSAYAAANNTLAIDPNVVICPYELGGTCADDQCPYQHLREDDGRNRTRSTASNDGNREGYIRYNNISKPKLPRPFMHDDFVIETETDRSKVDGEASLSLARSHHSMGERSNLRDECGAASRGEDSSAGDCPKNHDIQNNLDYVSLPPVIADSADEDSDSDSGYDSGSKVSIFHGAFWWQNVGSFTESPCINEGCRRDCFDSILLAFGFERLCVNQNEGTSYSLRYITGLTSINRESTQGRIEDILLFSRLIDLSRVLVHMGRDSFALSALSSICRTRSDDACNALIGGASRLIRSLSNGRCCLYHFEVQVHLLAVSETLRCAYEASQIEQIELLNRLVSNHRRLDTKLINMSLCSWQPGTMKRFQRELNLFPPGFDMLCDRLISRIPSTNHDNEEESDEWADFVKALRLAMEKFVVIPFTRLSTDEQLTFLFHSIAIGRFLGHVVRLASMGRRFVPYLHVLEPIWSSLQTLLNSSFGRKRWLRPEIISIVVIGPVIFGCVTDMIAPPGMCASSLKSPPMFDARAFANLSFLDTIILGILKDFGKRCNGRFVEPLMAPLHALSASICVALGSFEKAHVRLEHVLNKEAGSGDRKLPSIYALSEMLWSQLLQIRMICPSFSAPLNHARNSTKTLSNPSLPDDILRFHHEIASRIVENGIVLWGVKLRGDCHMNISPCINTKNRIEWEKVASQIFADRPVIAGDIKIELAPSTLEFNIWNPHPVFIGMKDRVAVFPECLFLLTNTLINLTLKECGLTKLPLSIGYHLTKLQVLDLSFNHLSELPASICSMTELEVMNVSHNRLRIFPDVLSRCISLRVLDVSLNQLTSFPPDLALQCNNLQSFLVNGNPAASSIWAAVLHRQTKPCRKTKKEDCVGQDGDEERVGEVRDSGPEAAFARIPTRERGKKRLRK